MLAFVAGLVFCGPLATGGYLMDLDQKHPMFFWVFLLIMLSIGTGALGTWFGLGGVVAILGVAFLMME